MQIKIDEQAIDDAIVLLKELKAEAENELEFKADKSKGRAAECLQSIANKTYAEINDAYILLFQQTIDVFTSIKAGFLDADKNMAAAIKNPAGQKHTGTSTNPGSSPQRPSAPRDDATFTIPQLPDPWVTPLPGVPDRSDEAARFVRPIEPLPGVPGRPDEAARFVRPIEPLPYVPDRPDEAARFVRPIEPLPYVPNRPDEAARFVRPIEPLPYVPGRPDEAARFVRPIEPLPYVPDRMNEAARFVPERPAVIRGELGYGDSALFLPRDDNGLRGSFGVPDSVASRNNEAVRGIFFTSTK